MDFVFVESYRVQIKVKDGSSFVTLYEVFNASTTEELDKAISKWIAETGRCEVLSKVLMPHYQAPTEKQINFIRNNSNLSYNFIRTRTRHEASKIIGATIRHDRGINEQDDVYHEEEF